ncbi:unnamed protein product [Gadus morhua 'NCC']
MAVTLQSEDQGPGLGVPARPGGPGPGLQGQSRGSGAGPGAPGPSQGTGASHRLGQEKRSGPVSHSTLQSGSKVTAVRGHCSQGQRSGVLGWS